MLTSGRIAPARSKTELERSHNVAVAEGKTRKKWLLGVEEAAVGGKQADWLGVEDRVGFVVHALISEEDGEAWVN